MATASVGLIVNSTISGNIAAANGGAIGILAAATITELANSTFSLNTALSGDAISIVLGGGITTLVSTIIAGNTVIGVGATGPDILDLNLLGGGIANECFNGLLVEQGPR